MITWFNERTKCCRKTGASWSLSQLFLFHWPLDDEVPSDSILGPLFTSIYTHLLGDLIQFQSFGQLYVDASSVSSPDLSTEFCILITFWLFDQLHLDHWRVISDLCTSSNSWPLPSHNTPTPTPWLSHLPSCSRKKARRKPWLFLFLPSLDSSLIGSLSKGLWTHLLSMFLGEKNQASISITSWPFCCCCLFGFFFSHFQSVFHTAACMVFLNLNWYNVTPLLKILQRDETSISNKDGKTGTRFILPYKMT